MGGNYKLFSIQFFKESVGQASFCTTNSPAVMDRSLAMALQIASHIPIELQGISVE